jgi:hypothetical protein
MLVIARASAKAAISAARTHSPPGRAAAAPRAIPAGRGWAAPRRSFRIGSRNSMSGPQQVLAEAVETGHSFTMRFPLTPRSNYSAIYNIQIWSSYGSTRYGSPPS